jgi:hypothetical protein
VGELLKIIYYPTYFDRRVLEPAPQVQSPTVEENFIVLRWNGVAEQGYRFQLASDMAFENVKINTVVSEPQVRIPYPASGIYYLRIRTVDKDGSSGAYSPTQRIEIPPKTYWPFAILAIVAAVLVL